jgi:lipopolysaccharide/colanic/teichoic acid biosynthesis glycosyltransferase
MNSSGSSKVSKASFKKIEAVRWLTANPEGEIGPPGVAEPPAAIRSWNYSTGKRLCDLIASVLTLIIVAPVLALAAFAVRISSRGPILFRQARLGRDGKEFTLLKFRTMRHESGRAGVRLTRTGDSRVTRVGSVLRKWKIDELPQLINVVRGEMSLVGPRPDLPEYLSVSNVAHRSILGLRPGLTGLASLHFRNEEAILESVPVEDLNHFYVTQVLPRKMQMDLAYAQKAGPMGDVGILLHTLLAIFRSDVRPS